MTTKSVIGRKCASFVEAKVKSDKVDAEVLAEPLAADYLPSVWVADEHTLAFERAHGAARCEGSTRGVSRPLRHRAR